MDDAVEIPVERSLDHLGIGDVAPDYLDVRVRVGLQVDHAHLESKPPTASPQRGVR